MKTVDYLGFVTVGAEAPLLVRAPDEARQDVLRRHGPDKVIFTDAEDRPTLEALLEAHQVGYAYLELPPPLADDALISAPDPDRSWRPDALRRLRHAVNDVSRGDVVFHEDYSFIPAMTEDQLDAFLQRAHGLLDDELCDTAAWEEFLLGEARAIAAFDPPLLQEVEAFPVDDETPTPLLSASDLSLRFRRGALGGPPSLVEQS